MKPYEVKWRDSVALQGWRFASTLTPDWKGHIITTVGYIVNETKDDLTMAMAKGENDDYCNWLSIPAAMVISRRKLK